MSKSTDLWANRNYMENDPRFEGHVVDVNDEDEIRCPYCGRLLMKGNLAPGSSIEVKCLRRECHKIIRIQKV